jgi:conjugative relaxase-like TrwC/TraI family protein
MLSVGKVNSAGRAASYFAADNYYTGSGEGPSEWMGRGAAALALSGAVGAKDFQNVLEGDVSFFGRNLGENLPEGRERLPGLDLTFSAPKSVSIMALVAGDQRLIEAHNLAVRETVEKIETSVATRRQIDGDIERETTGNAVVALFRHDTSRAQDPQLHTHAIFANATQGPDGKWRAIDARDWLKEGGSFIKEHGLAYRVALAANTKSG